jgi:hypothetical protein
VNEELNYPFGPSKKLLDTYRKATEEFVGRPLPRGRRGSMTSCPIANCYLSASVTTGRLIIYGRNGITPVEVKRLPQDVGAFVHYFDNGYYPDLVEQDLLF